MKIIALFPLVVATGLILRLHGYSNPGKTDISVGFGQMGEPNKQEVAGTKTNGPDLAPSNSEKTTRDAQETVPLKSNIPSDYLQKMLRTNYTVKLPDIPPINQTGQEELIKMFRDVKDERPPYLRNLIFTLACVGGDNVASEFISNIKLDFNFDTTKLIDLNYYSVLLDSLGYLARNNDSAFNYLLRITDTLNPSEWTRAGFLMVCASLSKTGRVEAEARLSEMASRIDSIDKASAIVDAFYGITIIHRDGIINDPEFMSLDDRGQSFAQWRSTVEGQRWYEWFRRIQEAEAKRKQQTR